MICSLMSFYVKYAGMVSNMYKCHLCSKDMKVKNITPTLEWHICNKCMGKSKLPIDPKYGVEQ